MFSLILPGRSMRHLRRGLLTLTLTIFFRKLIVWYVLMNRWDIPLRYGLYRRNTNHLPLFMQIDQNIASFS